MLKKVIPEKPTNGLSEGNKMFQQNILQKKEGGYYILVLVDQPVQEQ